MEAEPDTRGLVPGIHVLGTTSKEDVDGPDKPGWRHSESAGCLFDHQGQSFVEQNQRGTTAVASISTRAAFSTRRTTCTSAIAG